MGNPFPLGTMKLLSLCFDRVLAFTYLCNLPLNASAKFLSAKILPEDPGTSKSEVDELQNDRIQRQMNQNWSSQSEMT